MNEIIKVLLIEDNPGDVMLVRLALSAVAHTEFELDHAPCLADGLAYLEAHEVHVVLLDLSLPDSDHLKTFAKVYAEVPQIPIIVLTGFDDERAAIDALAEGAQDYLVKGQVESNLLVRAIRYAIERKRVDVALRTALKEKEVLLREVHHRVKNNLQIISSILDLQSAHIRDDGILRIFRESQNRIKSMALIHEKLYKSAGLAQVDFAVYLQSLTDHLFRSFGIPPQAVALNLDVDDIFLDIDTAIPCALIVNELVSNALKYAFPETRRDSGGRPKNGGQPGVKLANEICVGLNRNNGRMVLSVRDNGVGLPPDVDMSTTSSLGLKLVWMLTRQLGGTVDVESDQGTTFKIAF